MRKGVTGVGGLLAAIGVNHSALTLLLAAQVLPEIPEMGRKDAHREYVR